MNQGGIPRPDPDPFVFLGRGQPQQLLAGPMDITESQRAEALQRGQQDVLEMIARGAPLSDVLPAVCRLIEDQESGLLCSILLTDDCGRHTGAGFGPSLPTTFVQSLEGIQIASPYAGSCCKALDRGQEVVVPDIEADERWSASWRASNLGHGLRACRSIPIFGSDGKVLASVAVFRREPGDPGPSNKQLLGIATHLAGIAIERRRAEERERGLLVQAATANAQFRAFFEQGALFAGIMHTNGTIIEANRLCLEACGFTREEVVGKRFWECPWWNGSADLMERIEAASAQAAAGETFRAEMPYFVADGSERTVDLIILPIKDEVRRVMFLALTGTDITDRKRAEQELRETEDRLRQSEERFRSFAENGPQMVWSADGDGVSKYLNSRWCDYTGLTPEQTADPEHVRRVVHPDDFQKMMDQWAVAKGSGTPFEVEFRLKRASDGAYRWFLCRSMPVRDSRGQIVQWVGANADIDDQKRAEAALREADRRKDEFLATLAHELRSPLAPIRNSVQVMRLRGVADPQLQWARDVIDRQTQQLARLVDDLLDISRITRGKVQLKKQVLDLTDVVRCAVETARPLIEEQHHRLTVSVPPQAVLLEADPTRLEQILANLLNNAAKYTEPHGHIALAVEPGETDVAVRVRDDGVGIGSELLPRVFDMFVQAEPGKDRATGGLGIGLSLVQRLVELHDGSVSVQSDGPGQGSEFVVRLPALVNRPRQDTNASRMPEPSASPAGRRSR
jgi:PAS domain S-box-containing protein